MSRRHIHQAPYALVATATLALLTAAPGSASDRSSLALETPGHAFALAPMEPSSPPVPAGLRTDRLSPKQRERWQSIVALVLAEDPLGQPRHPTLRKMWDGVAASGHEVYVDLVRPSIVVRHAAGHFRIESIGPDGHIVAVVRLNLQTIDRAKVGDATHSGFRRFHGLERTERYAEVLGHELGHAVWALKDPVNARHLFVLQGGLSELSRAFLEAEPDQRTPIRKRMKDLGEQLEALEAPARAEEARVWEELLGREARIAERTLDSE